MGGWSEMSIATSIITTYDEASEQRRTDQIEPISTKYRMGEEVNTDQVNTNSNTLHTQAANDKLTRDIMFCLFIVFLLFSSTIIVI